MGHAKALARFVAVVLGLGVLGVPAVPMLGVSGTALAQSSAPAKPTNASPAAPAANPPPAADVMPAPAFPPDYGYPPGYSPEGYGYPPPPPESTEGFHQHDGFYLRVQTGIGFSNLTSTIGGTKTTMGGGGLAFSAAMGGVVARHLVLYGAFFNTLAANPDVQVGGTSVASGVANIEMQGIGPGVAYIFDSPNLYLSGTIAATRFWTGDGNGNQLDTSKIGLALELSVGKEWWVSPDWGLGIAGQFVGGSMKDQNQPTLTWSAAAVSLLFSATYN